MSSIVNEVFKHLSDDVIVQLTKQVGAKDPNQVKVAAKGITELLSEALGREAQRSESGLKQAIERDHDGNILNDLMGVLSGNSSVGNAKTTDGAGILGHLLGKKQLEAAQVVSQLSGLDIFKSGVLMQYIAPIIMGVLGKKQQQSSGLDLGGIMDILSGGSSQAQPRQSTGGGLLGQILDRDGDGSMMDDLMNIGVEILRKR